MIQEIGTRLIGSTIQGIVQTTSIVASSYYLYQLMPSFAFPSVNGAELGHKLGKSLEEGFREFGRGVDFEQLAKDIGRNSGDAFEAFMNEIFRSIDKKILWEIGPKYLLAGIATATAPLAATLAIRYVYHSLKAQIGQPKLATEVKTVTLATRSVGWVRGKANQFKALFLRVSEKAALQAIFNSKIDRRIQEFSHSLQLCQKNGGYMENLLLFGPGGTGKSMIAKEIAERSGYSYVRMSGGDLAQYINRGEHVSELNKLMKTAKSRPTVLFIDEVESLALDRSKMDRTQSFELLNAFLNHTGEPQKNLCIIAATNRPEDLDEAFVNRMDHKLEIAPPKYRERRDILDLQMRHFFTQRELESDFSLKLLDWMAFETEGLTGRSLFKLVNALKNRVSGSEENRLTKSLIQQVTREFIEVDRRGASLKNRMLRIFNANAA